MPSEQKDKTEQKTDKPKKYKKIKKKIKKKKKKTKQREVRGMHIPNDVANSLQSLLIYKMSPY